MARRGADTLNGFVDSGCVIRGELEFRSAFRVDGRVEGSVVSKSELVIGESGEVEGEIQVARCLVSGTVKGTIRASETVVLSPGAKVWGDLYSPAVVMEEGAFLDGKVTMRADEKGAKTPNP